MKKNKEMIKDVAIIVLLVAVISLIVYLILSSTAKKSDFISDLVNAQEKISYYIGSISSDTFNAYDKSQIITGYNNDDEIKNMDGNALAHIANKDEKLEISGETYYKISLDTLKENLKVDLSKYSDLEWYIKNGEVLRVKFTEEPEWWNYIMDTLKVPE